MKERPAGKTENQGKAQEVWFPVSLTFMVRMMLISLLMNQNSSLLVASILWKIGTNQVKVETLP